MKSPGRNRELPGDLDGKKILIVITGGIAAYKSAFLVRTLKRAGAQVRVLMTDAATRFVTPLTFEVLSGNSVPTDMFARREEPTVEHVELAGWPDLVVVAPATADFIGKMAGGLPGDLPSAVLCATMTPVLLAPAMNDGMWADPAVRRNIDILTGDGKRVVGPGSGELACGTSGSGRMAEPEEIFAAVEDFFGPGPLDGLRFIVTAGRTVEEIDPVRYISNYSSGRMGFALAEAASQRGAKVTLIHGAVDVEVPAVDSVKRVKSASNMKTAVIRALPSCDVLVMAAAVADYRPAHRATAKIKKEEEATTIELVKTPDILASVREKKKKGQIVVGFALETAKGEENAKKKIEAKGCDYMVLNMVGEDTGFGSGTNQVTLFRDGRKLLTTPVIGKKEAAGIILDMLLEDDRLGKAER